MSRIPTRHRLGGTLNGDREHAQFRTLRIGRTRGLTYRGDVFHTALVACIIRARTAGDALFLNGAATGGSTMIGSNFCSHCGSAPSATARFCGSCGTAVVRVPVTAPQTATVAEPVAVPASVSSPVHQPSRTFAGANSNHSSLPDDRNALPLNNGSDHAGSTRPTPASAVGSARFVGDAAPIAGIPVSRLLNAACYII